MLVITAGLLEFMLATRTAPPTPTLLAQGSEPCDSGDCTISCIKLGDTWLGEDAQWLIVNAIPRISGTSTDIVWKQAASSDHPPLKLIVEWYNGSVYHSATMDIDEDGICVDTDNPNGFIRCHKPGPMSPPELCDGYSGDWGGVAAAGAGGCLSSFIYGFDILNQIEVPEEEGIFCWERVSLTPGNNTALYGRPTCGSSPLTWSDDTDNAGWSCITVEERPGGDKANVRNVYYLYDS